MKTKLTAVLALSAVAVLGLNASAAIVAQQDFDSNNDALAGSFNPATGNQDGGGGDWWGVGSLAAWPQGTGVPFSLADDSVADVSGGGAFSGDLEGIYGQNADFSNNFFGICDSDEFGADQTASWSFDISGYTGLALSMDFASQKDESFSYSGDSFITVSASIDGGTPMTIFSITPQDNTASLSFRPMDSGDQASPSNLMYVSGDASLTKMFADGGMSTDPADFYLDKSVAATGAIDTFMADIAGSGSTLTLTVTADFPFEGAAFDNIVITGGPSSCALEGAKRNSRWQ